VSVGDEDVANALAVKRLQQRLDVLFISWARINDSHVTSADHIGARAVEGELRRVATHHAAKQRRDIDHLAVVRFEVDDEYGSGQVQAPRAWRALTVSRQMRTAMKVSPAKIMKAVSSWA
jgi:hypothetical protein